MSSQLNDRLQLLRAWCTHSVAIACKQNLTCLAVSQAALNLTALNICTLLLASTLKVADNSLSSHEESLFMLQCRQFALE